MSELQDRVLKEIDINGKLESLSFATKASVDHQVCYCFAIHHHSCFVQKIVGVIKSLESVGDVVDSQMETVKRWQVTKEGEEVVEWPICGVDKASCGVRVADCELRAALAAAKSIR